MIKLLMHRFTIKTVSVTACVVLLAALSACTHLTIPSQKTSSVEFNLFSSGFDLKKEAAFLEDMLSRMTLREKVAQMVQAEIQHISPDEVEQYGIGAVLNGGGSHPGKNKYASVNAWRALVKQYHDASMSSKAGRTPVPVLWGTDAVHGHNNLYGATIFPHNIALGAANNPDLTRAVFSATAADVRATGIKWAFSPTVAVARDDRWGRTYESFSEDPSIVSTHASSAVEGLQGFSLEELQKNRKVIATSKHFIGDGGTLSGIDQGDTQLNESQLLDIHGQSFLAALDAGAQTVMASFNSWNGKKVHASQYLITEVLKHQFGFDGFVIGDWNAHAQIPGCSNDSCAAAINAGVDMLMAPQDWKSLIANTEAQVKQGEITEQRINDAVRRILRVKYRAGLFSNEYPLWLDEQDDLAASHASLARQAVRESLVLLKNNDDTLPIRNSDHVLVIGATANSIANQSGGWTLSWQGDGNNNSDFPQGKSILQGIQGAVNAGNGRVTYDPTGAITKNTPLLGHYDVAVLVFGEEPYAEGAGDLKALQLPLETYKYLPLMKKLSEQNIPVVSIMVAGRPLSSSAFINASNAFIMAWLPGTEGDGIADVIIGNSDKSPRHDFSGRLAFSWPDSARQVDINNYPAYSEAPLFNVGYGLSYQNPIQLAQLSELDSPVFPTEQPQNTLPIFIKKALRPWSLFVGSAENWGVAINGNSGATADKRTVVVEASDNATQEDARRIQWSGQKLGQFYFQHKEPIDLSLIAKQNGHLTFKLKIEDAPKGNVLLRMDCRYPCSGELDITQFLRSLPARQWQTVSVDLHCFADKGAQLNKIDTPFLISSSDDMTLEVSDILIDAQKGNENEPMRKIPCSQAVSQTQNAGFAIKRAPPAASG